MKKIPYGVIDFKKLIDNDFIYVDKTMYLDKLENDKYTLLYLKPGRFGKSLFTSMMYYYYDVNSANEFERLFKDTYVYKNPTPNKNNYYVLKFDFSGLTTLNMSEEEMKENFNRKVLASINEFMSRYSFDFKIDTETKEPNLLLLSLLTNLKALLDSIALKHKLYIIIDEYDNFTNGILEDDSSLFKSVVSKNGFIKSFYAIIKEYIGLGVIDRFYATGICPVTLNSMTTGFNIATDISTKREYNSMIGLTHEEVKWLLKSLNINQDEVYDVMVNNYDGYRFSDDTEERVFNATLVMYFLSEYITGNQIPKKLYDNNIVVNYGKIDSLIKLQGNSFYKEIIRDILDNGEILGKLKTQFNLEEDFTRDDIISLLYYFGYLTINGMDDNYMVFSIPNKLMSDTYDNYFIKLLRDIDVEIEDNKLRESIKEIAEMGKIDLITNYVSEILESTSNRIFIKFDEKYVELIYKVLLKDTLKFNTYIEYPCNLGFVDIYMVGNREYTNYNIMVELKYISKDKYSDDLLEIKREEALNQLNDYVKDRRIDSSNLKKYIVIFSGSEIKLLENV